MTKQKTLFFLLFLIPALMFGQVKISKDFTSGIGKPYAVVDAKNKEYFTDGAGHTVAVKTDGEVVTIQRYDVEGQKEISRKAYEDFPKSSEVQSVIKVGNRLFYIYTVYDKKAKNFNANCREIDIAKGTFNAPVSLFTTGGDIKRGTPLEIIGFWGMQGGPFLDVITSFDKSKILINYRRAPESKNDEKSFDRIGFYVFDSGFGKIWGDEVTMPHTEAVMNNLAYTVTKDGTAHMLAYINDSKEFEMINIKGAKDVQKVKLDVDANLVFQSFNISEDISGNLVCSGFYATGREVKVNWTGNVAIAYNINGIKHFKLSPAGKTIESFSYDFPVDLINQYESDRSKEKNEKRESEGKAGIMDLQMRDVVIGADGSTTFVGEQYYVRNEFVGTSQKIVYYYADMVVTKVDKAGKLMWMKKLPKTQIGFAGKGGNGIRFIQGKTSSYVIYIDNPKNANISMKDVPAKQTDGRGGYLSAYKLDNATGEVTKHSLFDVDDLNGKEIFQFNTSRIFDYSDGLFMLEVYMKGKEDAMIKIKLNQ